MSILHDPIIAWSTCLTLSLSLSSAAAQKLGQHVGFVMVLGTYGILPAALIAPASWIVPLGEMGLAMGLLVPATRPLAALLTATLVLSYGAAMAFTLVQGGRVMDCGCSVGRARQPVSAALVWRNMVLALAAVNAIPAATRTLGTYDWIAITLAALIASALYALANLLIATQRVSRELLHV